MTPPSDAFTKKWLHPRYWPTWLGLGLLFVLARIGRPARRVLARGIARLFMRLNRRRVAIAQRNLELCFPDQPTEQRQQWVVRYFYLYFLGLLELGVIRRCPPGEQGLIAQTQIEPSWVFAQLRREPGVILTLHSVGLEWAGAVMGEYVPGSAIYKPFAKNEVLDWWFTRGRTRFGTKMLPREQGMRPHIRELRQGRSFFYIADEDLGAEHSVFALFFGQSKATLPLAGRVARLARVPIYPLIGLIDEEQGYRLVFSGPLCLLPTDNEQQEAEAINQIMENLIRQDPAQFMWSLKFFKTRPAGMPDRYR